MLKGTKYGQDRNYYFIQTNNAVEGIVRAIKSDLSRKLLALGVDQKTLDAAHAKSYLESCGAETVTNACANLLGPALPGVSQLSSLFPGWPKGPQLDDIAMLCFSDPANAPEMSRALPGFRGEEEMENRYMELHPVVARMMFGIRAEHKRNRTYDECYQAILEGNSVGLLLPGHYVSAGIVDDASGSIRIKDSWPGRKPEWNGDGFLQPLTRQEFDGIGVAGKIEQTVVYYKP
jgi:hypothetical protein